MVITLGEHREAARTTGARIGQPAPRGTPFGVGAFNRTPSGAVPPPPGRAPHAHAPRLLPPEWRHGRPVAAGIVPSSRRGGSIWREPPGAVAQRHLAGAPALPVKGRCSPIKGTMFTGASRAGPGGVPHHPASHCRLPPPLRLTSHASRLTPHVSRLTPHPTPPPPATPAPPGIRAMRRPRSRRGRSARPGPPPRSPRPSRRPRRW